jgi:nicotinamidase-related amidase
VTALPHNTALVLIDLQKAIDHPSWGERNNPGAEENVGLLLGHWRTSHRPIVHIRHISRLADSTYRDGEPGVEFKDVAMPAPGETILTKHNASAFVGTKLETLLRGRSIADIVIAGVITNNSVEATARMAGDLGFRTTVVSDATFTFGRRDYSGRYRGADEVHAMSLANLDGEYAAIRTTEEILRNAET